MRSRINQSTNRNQASLDRNSVPAVEVGFDGVWRPMYIDTLLPHPFLPSLKQLMLLDEQNPGHTTKISDLLLQQGSMFSFNLASLMQLCVQACLARLTYPLHLLVTADRQRWENLRDRIHLIGSLLSDASKLPLFNQTVVRTVADLLKQRDAFLAAEATKWAIKVAGTSGNRLIYQMMFQNETSFILIHSDLMIEAGTMRQAMWNKVLDNITITLAKTVASLDAGGNLHVLVRSTAENNAEVGRIWSTCLANPKLFLLAQHRRALLSAFTGIVCADQLVPVLGAAVPAHRALCQQRSVCDCDLDVHWFGSDLLSNDEQMRRWVVATLSRCTRS